MDGARRDVTRWEWRDGITAFALHSQRHLLWRPSPPGLGHQNTPDVIRISIGADQLLFDVSQDIVTAHQSGR